VSDTHQTTATAGTAIDVQVDGARKAAILMMSLGQEVSAEILKRLTDDEVRRITAEVTRIKALAPEQAEQVLAEFNRTIAGGTSYAIHGADFAKDMLVNALGAEPARKVLDQVSWQANMDADVLKAMERADSEQLAHSIQREHPQTLAIICSQLDRTTAGSLLLRFPSETRAEVVWRMAGLEKISPEVLRRIGSSLGPTLRTLGEFKRKPYGGRRAVAEILANFDGAVTEEILASIEKTNPEIVEEIRRLMVVFEDLSAIDQTGIKALLAALDRKVLTLALKGTSEQLREHFTGCMSQRGAEMLREDMEALGPVRLKDVEVAQHQVIAIARKLQADGVLSMRQSESDRYVV
jgi:flagellar motor switch protein FliG